MHVTALEVVSRWAAAGHEHPTLTKALWEREAKAQGVAYERWLLEGLPKLGSLSPKLAPWDFSSQYLGDASYRRNMARLHDDLRALSLVDSSYLPAGQSVLTATGTQVWSIEKLATLFPVYPPAVGAVKQEWRLEQAQLHRKPSIVLLQLLLDNGLQNLETYPDAGKDWFIGALDGEIGAFYELTLLDCDIESELPGALEGRPAHLREAYLQSFVNGYLGLEPKFISRLGFPYAREFQRTDAAVALAFFPYQALANKPVTGAFGPLLREKTEQLRTALYDSVKEMPVESALALYTPPHHES